MEDFAMIDSVERYIRGEMNPDERLYFEQLRKTATPITIASAATNNFPALRVII